MTLRYVSVCSGIEAATVAWHPLGWRPLLFAEISKFPSAVLQHHYPSVPNVGDFTTIQASTLPAGASCDLLVGGTPCQAFSIAGLRGGLSDARGNLALEFMRLADRLRPRWILWENVPGVLSSNGGRDFGSILGALGELGYGFAYRVLDAQFIGVPQRRRRVFVVGYLGDWRRAAAVLSERTSLRRDTPKKRAARNQVAGTLGAGATGGFGGDLDRCGAFDRHEGPTGVHGSVAHTLRAEGCDASEDGTGRGTPVIAFAENSRGEVRTTGDVSSALSTGGGKPGQGYPAIAFHMTQDPISGPASPALSANGLIGVTVWPPDVAPTLNASFAKYQGLEFQHAHQGAGLFTPAGLRVRRLTPRECERLQGFPDGYTAIPGAADTGRYHALGNSMAVVVMRWLGERIAIVDRYAAKVEALF